MGEIKPHASSHTQVKKAQVAHEGRLLQKTHQLTPTPTHHSCQREVDICAWVGNHHQKLFAK